jgi:hypothetical protein
MSGIWTPPDPDDWGVVQDIEPSERERQLPDGRVLKESRLTLSPEALDQMWAGFRCARCLEFDRIKELGAYPERCPCCGFPMAELQRKQLEQDFVGQHPGLVSGFPMDREMDHLERIAHEKRPLMTVPKGIK